MAPLSRPATRVMLPVMPPTALRTLCAVLALGACRPAVAPVAGPVPRAGAAPGAVWQFTYLKALPGELARLERFVERNWFVMDARARAAGYIVDNQLLRGGGADTTWDLLEVSFYRDSLQHAQVDSIFRTIISPQHRVELIDGKGFRALGRVVKEETLRWRARSPDTPP
jgi:hypothetical protein